MSYLSLPRLTFSGLFEADVNTVNNDVRNYSVETFQPHAGGMRTWSDLGKSP